MAGVPDKAEQQRRFVALEFTDRRAIIKAVNRGVAVEKRAHAGLAVNVARRQQRFWKVAWLLGPLVGVLQLTFAAPAAALANGIIGTAMLAALALFWHRRARRSEALNLALVDGARGSARRTGRGTDSSGHLPGERRTARAAADGDGGDAMPGAADELPGHRPYKPRGRKRSSR